MLDFIPGLSGYGPGVRERIVDYLRVAEEGEVIRFGRVLLPLRAMDSPLLDVLGVSHIVTTHRKCEDKAVAGWSDTAMITWQLRGGMETAVSRWQRWAVSWMSPCSWPVEPKAA